MGRIFEKRKYRMFARWAKTARAFTKLGKEIAIAIKLGGTDPTGNPRLRMAINTARSLNMPKDRIDAAIKRASGKEQADLAEIVYAAFCGQGVTLAIVAATDNPTRTVANIRSILTKHQASLGSSTVIDTLFKHLGYIRIKTPNIDLDSFQLDLIENGLEEFEQEGDECQLAVSFASFGRCQQLLEEKTIQVISAGLSYAAKTPIDVDQQRSDKIQELIDALEEDDDIQHVFSNLP